VPHTLPKPQTRIFAATASSTTLTFPGIADFLPDIAKQRAQFAEKAGVTGLTL